MLKTKKYNLPPPPLGDKDGDVWLQIPRLKGLQIPFGYKVNEDDPRLLDPVPIELDLLEQAKKFVNQYTYKEVAAWLTERAGRKITAPGLFRRIASDKRNKQKASSYRRWAGYVQEALQAAQEIETKRAGAKGKYCSPCTDYRRSGEY